MYLTEQMIISETGSPELFSYMAHHSALAKSLYNAALFRIRQIFTGYDKASRTANEAAVFDEIKLLQTMHPHMKVKKVISYTHLEKLMRVTDNPDFFAGLPMQTAQQMLKMAAGDFKNWLDSLKKYKKNPSSYTGRPQMPGYKKREHCTFVITNQDAVLYPASGKRKEGSELKLPLIKVRPEIPRVPADAKVSEVKIKPYYGRFRLLVTYETEELPVRADMPELAAVDFGAENAAAIVCTDQSSRIYKGGAILSRNRWFAKEHAKASGIITKGHEHRKADSLYLKNLSYHRANFNRDQMHKISNDIIRFCLEHRAGTLILGVNKNWKQNIHMGKANNQKFAMVPLALLRALITYKAEKAGIRVLEQEESYTSKADITAGDHIPVYGANDNKTVFSGRRICRGLYRCMNGLVINADCNAAANIMRKAIPDAWYCCDDFSFLACPEVINFRRLNNAV